jgi:hypothetical protein
VQCVSKYIIRNKLNCVHVLNVNVCQEVPISWPGSAVNEQIRHLFLSNPRDFSLYSPPKLCELKLCAKLL